MLRKALVQIILAVIERGVVQWEGCNSQSYADPVEKCPVRI